MINPGDPIRPSVYRGHQFLGMSKREHYVLELTKAYLSNPATVDETGAIISPESIVADSIALADLLITEYNNS